MSTLGPSPDNSNFDHGYGLFEHVELVGARHDSGQMRQNHIVYIVRIVEMKEEGIERNRLITWYGLRISKGL